MARLADLALKHRLFMRSYRFRRHDWSPGAHMDKPLARSRIAVVTTAALHEASQQPFDESLKGGDVSYRELPSSTDLQRLQIAHRSDAFDVAALEADKNVALPLDRLRELAGEGVIGELNHRHFSFMGSITAPGRLTARTAPEVARKLLADDVDVALLTPV
jgi:D-proline reductase (dithiol) PrdB